MNSPATPVPRHVVPPGPRSRQSPFGLGRLADVSFKVLCQLAAWVPLIVLGLLVAVLVQQAWPAITRIGAKFLILREWNPNSDQYGAVAFIYGSLITSIIGMVIAVPLGVGTAAFLAEIAPRWMRRPASFLVELLAAIPSVVYGFWGITFLAPIVQGIFNLAHGPNVGGYGLLSAGLILAIMCVPYVAAVSFDVIGAVPQAQREGALALGATRWQMISRVVLPYAWPGIIGACFLALGRAIGETMAVTMIVGNVSAVELLPFGQGNTIPSVIAQQLPSAVSSLHEASLIELGVILLGVTVILNVCARFFVRRVSQIGGRGKSRIQALRNRIPGPKIPTLRLGRWIAPAGQLGRARWTSGLMTSLLGLCLALTLIPLFLILGYIAYRGFDSLSWHFFTDLPKPMGSDQTGGMVNAIYGSALMVGLATLFAVPIGILAAVYLAEYRRNRLGPVVRFVSEILVGVPSIVTGLFVYALVRYIIHHLHLLSPRNQFSGWAGAAALAIMMLPVIVRATEEALRLVPQSLRHASHALGAHHWQAVLWVTVPAARSAIITGIFLAIGRIAGETAPLLLTAFGNLNMAYSPSEQMPALPVYIYHDAMSPYPTFVSQGWAAAFVLLTFVLILNIGVRAMTGKRVVQAANA